MFVTACACSAMRREPSVFIDGERALQEGAESAHIVAFARRHGRNMVVAAVPS